ncbi:hypothetical protein JTE90_021625 [Oedothorax gibbosus]|uniref:Uncharacterized protein n=1 Tax=Oedothorax gibbosus TaxID=931172 RepID=A0AAV6VQG7_9ARAC|nr:hypothetical protein JTE90_021625 [Oedothorax gibbosus]
MRDVYFIHDCSHVTRLCCCSPNLPKCLIEINKGAAGVPSSLTWRDEKSSSFRQGILNPSRLRFPKGLPGDAHLCIYIYLLLLPSIPAAWMAMARGANLG